MNDTTGRVLSAPERAALEALITRGGTGYVTVTDTDRARWLKQVPSTAAGATCTCGTCPSIELIHSGAASPTPALTVVLQAYADDALLLLFIEKGHLSYLELAPLAPAGSITAFPPPEQIQA